jgi:hypothetical protein
MACIDGGFMDVRSFKDRFDLSYLEKSVAPQTTPATRPEIDEAVIAYGSKVLSAMKQAPSIKMFDLASGLSLRVDVVIAVLQSLRQTGLVERVHEDPIGNDSYALTAAGARLDV